MTSTPATDRESRIRDIQSLLASNLQFRRFRPELEAGFIAHVRDRAQRLSRDSLWITIVMYLITAVLGWWQVGRFSEPVHRDGNLAAMAWLLGVEGVMLAFVLVVLEAKAVEVKMLATVLLCKSVPMAQLLLHLAV